MIHLLQTQSAKLGLIISILGICLLIALFVGIFLSARRKKHASQYPLLLAAFKRATEQNDVEAIVQIGDKLIWNESFSIADREFVFEAIDARVETEPQLKKVWEHAHFKRFGVYPEQSK